MTITCAEARLLAAAAIAGAVACGTTNTGPSTDMSGVYDFSFDTMTTGLCPTAPPGHPAGCQASGVATLDQAGVGITGTAVLSGSCQRCGSVADFRGLAQPVVGSLEQSHLEFAVDGRCSFTGMAVAGQSAFSGEATCPIDGADTNGVWRLSRRP